MKTEEYDLLLKRKEMSKESWIKNVMRIHPDKTREETEALWQKIFEADEVARLIAPEPFKTNQEEEESQENMLDEIIENWDDNERAKRLGETAESRELFIKAELEKFTITRK